MQGSPNPIVIISRIRGKHNLTVLLSNLLCAEMLLHGDGVVGASFDPGRTINSCLVIFCQSQAAHLRAVVGQYHAKCSLNASHSGDYATPRNVLIWV